LNESLRRALLRAGLSEEDVAARLEVDPKTVRRWVEGRVPHPRHRWVLARLLGVDEADLWPQLRAAGPIPAEVQAVYPHLGAVPRDMWLRLFRSAGQRIDILTESGDSVIEDPGVQELLARKGRAGIAVRICLVDSGVTGGNDRDAARVQASASCRPILAEALSGSGSCVEVRRRSGPLYAAIYRADDELLVSQRAYGILPAQALVLHLLGHADGSLAATYANSFERLWAGQALDR
jgi:transcriptional regulator with XRE-family HTH domain